jgi:hypothetical protein
MSGTNGYGARDAGVRARQIRGAVRAQSKAQGIQTTRGGPSGSFSSPASNLIDTELIATLGNVTLTSAAPTSPSGTYFSAPSTNNNVSIVTSSPFSGGGRSYSFSSSPPNPDYLTVIADSSWAFGTGDFTIEWFQNQTDINLYPRIFSVGSASTFNTSIACSIETPTNALYAWFSGSQSYGSVTPYKNVWVHFAIVRQSGLLKVYKNGAMISTAKANTTNITNNTTPLYIGLQQDQLASTQFLGNLTNIRIVKGLAVYTGNFTVPTSALTPTAGANPYGGANTQAIPDGYTKLLLVPT